MKKFVIITAAVLLAVLPAQARKRGTSKVVFETSGVHCKNCVAKVTENISFEKGVTDLAVSIEEKTLAVSFNPAKTDTAAIARAIRKLGYGAKVISFTEEEK